MTESTTRSGIPGWRRLSLFLESIKFQHSMFALPFAVLAAFLSASGTPEWNGLLWVLVAMVGMRTFGMAANRLIDAEIDARNPRTATRAIPTGTISRRAMIGYMTFAGLIFVVATSLVCRSGRRIWPARAPGRWRVASRRVDGRHAHP